jgi:hypothetical protein
MPSLKDLSGPVPSGYKSAVALADPNRRPASWFVDRYDEFAPPLLVLGTYYYVQAVGPAEACVEATRAFQSELTQHKMPLPFDPVHAELAL